MGELSLGKLRKYGKIRKVADLPAGRTISKEQIPLRKEALGREEDPLEKAAMQGVGGTLPERIVWKWLEDRGRLYEMQRAEMGGRFWVGGAVVDFYLYDEGTAPVVVRVMGDYWHGPAFPGRVARDDDQAERLRLQGYRVTDVWEGELYEAVLGDRLDRFMREMISDAM